MKKNSNNNSNFYEYIRIGFGTGIGFGFSQIIFTIIGLIFFIPGILLLLNERKKPKENQNKTTIIVSYVLMVIGIIIGFSMGALFILDNIDTDF